MSSLRGKWLDLSVRLSLAFLSDAGSGGNAIILYSIYIYIYIYNMCTKNYIYIYIYIYTYTHTRNVYSSTVPYVSPGCFGVVLFFPVGRMVMTMTMRMVMMI